MPKKFELSEVTAHTVATLQMIEKNMSITYPELSRLVGSVCDPRNTRYARHILQRDHSQVWVCVRPAVGLRRLNDAEIAERLPHFFLNGARRKLKRGADQAETVELKQLDIDQQVKFSVDCIQAQLAAEALSKATRRRMEKVARGTSNDLPTFNAVEWAISLMPSRSK